MIIGIDPGPEFSAVVEFSANKPFRITPVTKGVKFDHRWPNHMIIGYLKEINNAYVSIACETFDNYGMPIGNHGFNTLMWIGEFRRVAKDKNIVFYELRAKSDIKMNVCHSSKAKKGNVSQSLRDRFGGKGTVNVPGPTFGFASHTWDALAAAVTAYDKFYGGAS